MYFTPISPSFAVCVVSPISNYADKVAGHQVASLKMHISTVYKRQASQTFQLIKDRFFFKSQYMRVKRGPH